MSDNFDENYEEFSKEDDMLFCRGMLLAYIFRSPRRVSLYL